jgi:DNA-binding NarL/FixJ family response regulator
MESEISLVIADDHPLMRRGIRQTLEAASGFRILAEAGDGKAALDLVLRLRPQVAVLDISMPLVDGFGVVRELRKRALRVEIVFLTAQSDESLFEEAVALDVKGYVLKECAASDMVLCLRAVAAGQHYVSPTLTTYLVSGRQQPKSRSSEADLGDLTGAEMRVLRLVSQLKTTREIAPGTRYRNTWIPVFSPFPPPAILGKVLSLGIVRKMTMLIVDDSAKMRHYIRSAIGDLAESIIEGGDGMQAIALYADHQPDWLVIDIAMPVLDGIEATRRIRKSSPTARIVVLTVFNDPALREAARDAGAAAYVLKENLLDLRRILSERHDTREAPEGIPQ